MDNGVKDGLDVWIVVDTNTNDPDPMSVSSISVCETRDEAEALVRDIIDKDVRENGWRRDDVAEVGEGIWEYRCGGIVLKIDKVRICTKEIVRLLRRDRLLNEMSEEIVRYSSLRDDEWEFEDNNSQIVRAYWTDDDVKAHDEILGGIQESRDRLKALVSEALGEETDV